MKKEIYRIRFVNDDKIYELYAKHVYQAEMIGFVVIEDIVFDKAGQVVIDPNEEKLRIEFEDVKQTYIPMHAIIRIDQVKKRGTAKVLPVQGSVSQFPSSIYNASPDSDK